MFPAFTLNAVSPGRTAKSFVRAYESIAICRGGGFRAFRYLKSPTDIEFEASAPGIAPRAWDDVVFGAQWAGDVRDLGLRSIEGRQARGFTLAFRSVSGGEPVQAEYWFDVETAQLLERAEMLAKRSDVEALAYRLDHVVPPPIDISGAKEIPGCVQNIIDELQA